VRPRQLPLPGWEDESAWGFDDEQASFYAILVSNQPATDRDRPQFRLRTSPTIKLTSESELARVIALSTGANIQDVQNAMRSAS
jgi:hypothetical protein